MTRSRYSFLLLVLALPVILTAPAALAQTRVVPNGDLFDDAINIPLNSTKTVYGIEEATIEPTYDWVTSCDANDSATNSIWFKFSLPKAAYLDFYSSGTVLLSTGVTASIPIMSVFAYDPGTGLSEISCTPATNALMGGYFSPDEYRVRLAYDLASPLVEGARYRLSVRVRHYFDSLTNSFFVTEPVSEWKITNAGTPAKVFWGCPSGACGIVFQGIAKGKVSQTFVPSPSQLRLLAGDMLRAMVWVNQTPAAGSNVKLKVKLTYSDGTPANSGVSKQHLTYTSVGAVYFISKPLYVDILSGAVAKIKVSVSSPQATDTFKIGHVNLDIMTGGFRSAEGVLAVPAPAGP